MTVTIRPESPADADDIRRITDDAFADVPYSSGTEGAIVDALRRSGRMTLSLVAEEYADIIGHIAFSPVVLDGQAGGWFALGPVAVRPDRQQRGIGAALIKEGIARLHEMGADGVLLVGAPEYYERFGFVNDPAIRYDAAPARYLLRLILSGEPPSGRVSFDVAFEAT